ncbi:phage baseplate assembly protein V [Photobacterium damselae subsp. damselae]|uniref:phage baseplate assembly protein V n=1 Tax=Photobacterium damselae TaxID=38293 RepID=UPI001EEDA5E7|nr:phage baseplate assembly protein V [Photobacterium damselae]UJZ95044.1 phage baseplate assembly protein V [Photobacterium damselae subsp. damselae]UJZ99025.1 phage baseplate assembly protein V [Photobacterium damselae subsp. damselae]
MFKSLQDSMGKITSRLAKMICVGEVTAVNADSHQVKVVLKGFDNIETVWLPVISMRAKGVNAVHNLEVGEQVVCLFPPIGDMAKGFVIGASYNVQDKPAFNDPDVFGMKFNDGTIIKYNQQTSELLVQIKGGQPLFKMTPSGTKLVSDFEIIGNVSISKNLIVNQNITAGTLNVGGATMDKAGNISTTGSIADATSTMDKIRVIYNGHNHDTPKGPSSTPNQPMQ